MVGLGDLLSSGRDLLSRGRDLLSRGRGRVRGRVGVGVEVGPEGSR